MSVPYVMREAFRNPDNGKSYLPEVLKLDYTWESTGEGLILRIPASAAYPVFLFDVAHIVRVLFSGGTPAIDVGDGTTADGYIKAASITEGTAGDLAYARDKANAEVISEGKYLTANAQIKVTLSASLAAGAGTVLAFLYRMA